MYPPKNGMKKSWKAYKQVPVNWIDVCLFVFSQVLIVLFILSVLNDIVATMFNKRFMEELFKAQPLYSKKAMRTVFDRLAHASIMRLNAASMDKVN